MSEVENKTEAEVTEQVVEETTEKATEAKDNKKKEPWRIIVGILAIAFIVYMWVEKDIMTIYTTMPKEQVAPLIATTIAASFLIKVAAITGGILLIKWIISKFKNK